MVISNIIHIVIICIVVSHFDHQRAVNTHHNHSQLQVKTSNNL